MHTDALKPTHPHVIVTHPSDTEGGPTTWQTSVLLKCPITTKVTTTTIVGGGAATETPLPPPRPIPQLTAMVQLGKRFKKRRGQRVFILAEIECPSSQ